MDEQINELNIDMSKRTPEEWANIYHIRLYSAFPRVLWTEFEWCYNMINMDYQYISEKVEGELSSEKAEEMELRAMEIKNLIFQLAEPAEKNILKDRYIETEWIKKRLLISGI